MGTINVEPSLQNQIVMESPSRVFGISKHVDFNADFIGSPIFQMTNITSDGRDSIGLGIDDNSALVLEDSSHETEFVESKQDEGVGISLTDGHCKTQEHDGSDLLTEVVTDDVDSSSSHHGKEQLEEDEENDEMFGGIFSFSEEGIKGCSCSCIYPKVFVLFFLVSSYYLLLVYYQLIH